MGSRPSIPGSTPLHLLPNKKVVTNKQKRQRRHDKRPLLTWAVSYGGWCGRRRRILADAITWVVSASAPAVARVDHVPVADTVHRAPASRGNPTASAAAAGRKTTTRRQTVRPLYDKKCSAAGAENI